MNNIYTNKLKIQYSDVDKHLKLKLFCAVNFVQNDMTNLFEQMNITNARLKAEQGAFWVVSKLKIHFNRCPILCDELKTKSFIAKYSKARLGVVYNFSDMSDESAFVAYQELCLMDIVTRRVRLLGQIVDDRHVISEDVSFSKFRWDVEEFTKVYSYTIMYDDVDSNCHVNNARYLSFVVNALGSQFFDKSTITDIELHYINECIEGTHINVYKRSFDGAIGVIIMCGQTEVLKAKLHVQSLQ